MPDVVPGHRLRCVAELVLRRLDALSLFLVGRRLCPQIPELILPNGFRQIGTRLCRPLEGALERPLEFIVGLLKQLGAWPYDGYPILTQSQ